MIKFTQLMTFGLGDKTVSFNGREPFTIGDKDFKKELLAIGVFEEQENGDLVYSGAVSVPMKDGSEANIDPRGFLAVNKDDMKTMPDKASFR